MIRRTKIAVAVATELDEKQVVRAILFRRSWQKVKMVKCYRRDEGICSS